ncbi:hypothetical protein GGI12_005262, partial [Dipsacomyces acuminosporus]
INGTPVPGCIAQTTAGVYGHVAYVTKVSGNSVTVEEYNHGGSKRYGTRTVPKSSFNYIHLRAVNHSVQFGMADVNTGRAFDALSPEERDIYLGEIEADFRKWTAETRPKAGFVFYPSTRQIMKAISTLYQTLADIDFSDIFSRYYLRPLAYMGVLDYIPDGSDPTELYHFKLYNSFQMFLAMAGCGAVCYFTLKILDIISDLWIREPIAVESFGADEGYWAVVTGCTDGIGKAIALELGAKGYNLVLLSRTQSKLDEVRDELLGMGVEVDAYSVDFSKTTKEQWDRIETMVKSKRVSILVNNVAVCHLTTTSFMEESPEMCKQMVDVNIVTLMKMTRLVVPQMRERKNGLILNIGSWTSMRSMPYLPVYAGTKGFVKTFSQSLAYELKPLGITVEHVFSFWVKSKMSGYKNSSITIPSADTYATHLLSHIGRMCGTLEAHSSIPYYAHSFLAFCTNNLWDSRLTSPALY